MARVLYVSLPTSTVAGGVKMIFRHVEILRSLGFDAAVTVRSLEAATPRWFEFTAPIVALEDPASRPRPGDLLVIPEDSLANLADLASHPGPKVIFCQNQFYAHRGLGRLDPEQLAAYGDVMACSATTAAWLRRRFPSLRVEMIPDFADETIFRPPVSSSPRTAIALAPRKRRPEAGFLMDAFRAFYPRHAALRWLVIDEAPEEETARILAEAGVLLSLSRLEGLGLLPLEAMASDCLVAGYTGIGGREYATAENGFWADDVEEVLAALAAAADLNAEGGSARQAMQAAGRRTAAAWSRAVATEGLDRFFTPRVERTL